MAEAKHICLNCMHDKKENIVCPQCGMEEGKLISSPHHLKPGTILHQKYLVGRVLGEGGFGVTYLGWDLQLDMKLAIKEFLPKDFATRHTGNLQITIFTGDYQHHFENGLKKFIEEAKILAKYNNLPGIVSVRDFFEDHSTAYLVMYYLDGIDLRSYLEQVGGKLAYDQALAILMPVMDALKEIHKDGLLHRDISPDNIYVTTEGEIKLLDFGAARHAFNDNNKSLSVILKPGYAPEEQYRSKGRQGPWTDVYAVAATYYRMIVGQTPPDSLDRLESDTLLHPSRIGVSIPTHIENTLMKALAIKSQNRFQSIEEFQSSLSGQGQMNNFYTSTPHQTQPISSHSSQNAYNPTSSQKTIPALQQNSMSNLANGFPSMPSQPPKKKNMALLISLIAGGGLILAVALFFFVFNLAVNSNKVANDNNDNLDSDVIDSNGQNSNNNGQDPNTDSEPDNEPIIVSLPTLYNLTEDEAIRSLQSVGLSANIIYEENLITKEGRVFDQGVLPDTELEEGSTVDVYVNSGVAIPFDLTTVDDITLEDSFEMYMDDGYAEFDNNQLESALEYLTQSYLMSEEMFLRWNDDDILYYQAMLLLDIAKLKEQLGFNYYAEETTLDAVAVIDTLTMIEPEGYNVEAGYTYSQLAWHQLLNYKPDEALNAANISVQYDQQDLFNVLVWAHALMLTDSSQEAYASYVYLWDLTDTRGMSFSEHILTDFDTLLSTGYPNTTIDEMERALLEYDSQ